MARQQTITSLRTYILENFLYMHAGAHLADEDPLIGSGILDSMGVVELIAFMEEEFGISVADADVTEAHFGTIAALGRLVDAKRASDVAA